MDEIIAIDLHIHSKASEYKDGDVVRDSDIDHLDVLFSKLEEYKIQLFAITDHNRFDYDLYCAIREAISKKELHYIKKNLPAVEFDVQLESDNPHCHIIAVFNDNDEAKIAAIEKNIFQVKKIKEENDFYSIDEFEKIIKRIGLQTILIVHQKQSLDNKKKGSRSLSSSVNNPYEIIKFGYVDALEYSHPKVEGIIKSNLHDINMSFSLITGSDCHEWKSYPYHDSSSKSERNFTKLKCLPTFKGLLLSISSFSTRANRNENINQAFIKSFSINGNDIPLSKGINAIIGDNGAGKSLLVSVLSQSKKSEYAKLIKENNIVSNPSDDLQISNINTIHQGQIAEDVRNGDLFSADKNEYYNPIFSHDEFVKNINNYFDDICSYIKQNISVIEGRKELESTVLEIKDNIRTSFYYPVFIKDLDIIDISNEIKYKDGLMNVYRQYRAEIIKGEDFFHSIGLYDKLITNLKEMRQILAELILYIHKNNANNQIRGIVINQITNKTVKYNAVRSSAEKEKELYIQNKQNFISSIILQTEKSNRKNKFPDFPSPLKGMSEKQYKGYSFKKIANYNDLDLKKEFYSRCFNKDYQSEEKVRGISSRDELSNALFRGNYNELENYKKTTIENFTSEWKKEKTQISSISSNEDIGNTPGEISLVYYKFIVQESDNNYDVLIIDQPEDDINPVKINEYLLSYLNGIRDQKQIILVTHNPLMVVNLDVDNVVYLLKNKTQIIAKSGPLEYENEEYSVLELVMNNLDGGYDAVERRLKVYGGD